MSWNNSQSTVRPIEIETGKTTTFLRRNITQTDDGYEYEELVISNDDAQAMIDVLKPKTDYYEALLGIDDSPINKSNWSARVKKYKQYYKSGQWTIHQIDRLLERGIITREEYEYITC